MTSYIKQYHYYSFSIANPFRFEKCYFYVKEIFLSNKNNQIIRMLARHLLLVSFLRRNTENCFSFTMLDGQTNMITLTTGSFIIKNSVYENIYSTSRGAILCDSINIQLHVEETTFTKCCITSQGSNQQGFIVGPINGGSYGNGALYMNYYTGGGAITYICQNNDVVFAGLSVLKVCVTNCSSRNHLFQHIATHCYQYFSEGQYIIPKMFMLI